MNEDNWCEIFDYNTIDTLKISLNVSRLFNKLSNDILKDIVYGRHNWKIIAMKKLPDTKTDENRNDIVDKYYARYKADKLLLYKENEYVYDKYYYLREDYIIYNNEMNGKRIKWYDNGQKEKECIYKDGKPDGKYKALYGNGQKFIECIYKNGKLDGKFEAWRFNGVKTGEYVFTGEESNTECKVIIGEFRIYQYYDSHGFSMY